MSKIQKISTYTLFLLLLLGLMNTFSPLINNMYSAAMPQIQEYLGGDAAQATLGLTWGMIGLAIGQVIIGPMSDVLGRKRPLILSLSIFTIASALVLVHDSLYWLLTIRFIQGLSGSGAVLLSRSIASDYFQGKALLRSMAIINVVVGLSPIVLPMLTSWLLAHYTWHSIFAVMAIVGLLTALLCLLLNDRHPNQDLAHRRSIATSLLLLIDVFRCRSCIGYIMHQGFAQLLLFGNLASAPYIVTSYGHDPGLWLGFNGIFVAAGAALAPMLGMGKRGVWVSNVGMIVFSILLGIVLWQDLGFTAYQVALCPMLGFMGITLTSSTVLALEKAPQVAGSVAAVLGTVACLVGVVSAIFISSGDIALYTAITYILGALWATAAAYLSE